MSIISTTIGIWELNRFQTIALLDRVAQLPHPQEVLGWRPGPGRAHIAWQLMHIAITEELFATERLVGTRPADPELAARFRGGSTPDDTIPTVEDVRNTLQESRQHLLDTIGRFSDSDLDTIPETFKDRGWSIGRILQVLTWHEPHHQGQAHLTLNLYKAQQG